MRHLTTSVIVVLVVATALAGGRSAGAQTTTPAATTPTATAQRETPHEIPGQWLRDVQKRRDEIATRHEAMMVRLDALSKTMNQATGQAKIDAMAALLNELVAQQKATLEKAGAQTTGRFEPARRRRVPPGARNRVAPASQPTPPPDGKNPTP